MSLNTPPHIFDRRQRRRNMNRRVSGFEDHAFILNRTVDDIVERLSFTNRSFKNVLVFGATTRTCQEKLSTAFKDAQINFAHLISEGGLADICFDCEAWPIGEQRLDLIISLLDLHTINDLPGTLLLMRKSLQPDGLFLGAMFGTNTLSALRESLTQAESECRNGTSAHIFPFADIRDMGGLLQRAGFALPVADCESIHVTYPHILALFHDLRGMGESNILVERPRTGLSRVVIQRTHEIYVDRCGLDDGRIPVEFNINYLSGWGPAPTQQKPLKPGSATHRLAGALGTKEHGIKES